MPNFQDSLKYCSVLWPWCSFQDCSPTALVAQKRGHEAGGRVLQGGGLMLWPMAVIKPKLLLLFLQAVLNLSGPQRDYSVPAELWHPESVKYPRRDLLPPAPWPCCSMGSKPSFIGQGAASRAQGQHEGTALAASLHPSPSEVGLLAVPKDSPHQAAPALLSPGTGWENPASWGGAK